MGWLVGKIGQIEVGRGPEQNLQRGFEADSQPIRSRYLDGRKWLVPGFRRLNRSWSRYDVAGTFHDGYLGANDGMEQSMRYLMRLDH